MQTLCVDIGNYSTLSAVVEGRESSEVFKMRSLLYDATHNGECRNNVHPVESPLVEVKGKIYKLGTQAKLYPQFLTMAEAGKSRPELLLPILLANTPNGFEGSVKMLVPTRDDFKEKLITNEVVNTHTYKITVNSVTTDAIANFTSVEFVRETDAAVRFGYESGVIDPDVTVLGIDVGGGTANVVICNYDDDVFNTIFRKSYDNSGGIALAQTIANTDVVKNSGRTFEIAKIMDAITDGRTYISNRRDMSFASVWESSVDVWFDALLSRVMSACDRYLDEVSQIVWLGGGTEILKARLLHQPGNLVLDNPQYANINGLIHSAKLPHLRVAA